MYHHLNAKTKEEHSSSYVQNHISHKSKNPFSIALESSKTILFLYIFKFKMFHQSRPLNSSKTNYPIKTKYLYYNFGAIRTSDVLTNGIFQRHIVDVGIWYLTGDQLWWTTTHHYLLCPAVVNSVVISFALKRNRHRHISPTAARLLVLFLVKFCSHSLFSV